MHVLEARQPGYGASTRNSGFIGGHLRKAFVPLAAKVGSGRAGEMIRAGRTAHDYLVMLMAREGIECDFVRQGRFVAAHSPNAFDALSRELEQSHKYAGVEGWLVNRKDQTAELGSNLFYGGLVYPYSGTLHPGKYHHGLLHAALRAGVVIHANCKVQSINSDAATGFRVESDKDQIGAEHVFAATNTYTGKENIWFRRRIVSIYSHVVTTE